MARRPKIPKAKLEQLLLERGLAKDLPEARALVMRGAVLSGDTRLDQAAALFRPDLPLRLRGRKGAVSRSGAKLAAALEAWSLDLKGKRCLDVGASTGGFTQVMLRAGAAEVLAVDVGTNQLAYELRRDPRVRSLERTDIRRLDPAAAGGRLDFAAVDVSFVRLARVLPAVAELLKPGSAWVALVKPQFEAPAGKVGAGGVLRDPGLQASLLADVAQAAERLGLGPGPSMASPLKGAHGNQEFLLLGQRSRVIQK